MRDERGIEFPPPRTTAAKIRLKSKTTSDKQLMSPVESQSSDTKQHRSPINVSRNKGRPPKDGESAMTPQTLKRYKRIKSVSTYKKKKYSASRKLIANERWKKSSESSNEESGEESGEGSADVSSPLNSSLKSSCKQRYWRARAKLIPYTLSTKVSQLICLSITVILMSVNLIYNLLCLQETIIQG